MRKLIDMLVIFNPSYWFMSDKYDAEWNKTLKHLMNNHKFEPYDGIGIKQCYICIGDYIIWIANHPYASFTKPSNGKIFTNGRPSKLTILRAKRKMEKDLLPVEKKRNIKFNKIMANPTGIFPYVDNLIQIYDLVESTHHNYDYKLQTSEGYYIYIIANNGGFGIHYEIPKELYYNIKSISFCNYAISKHPYGYKADILKLIIKKRMTKFARL